uniref:Uncharacterized protein n=1 Tax=Anguilla anguilla TaxID=7936 RepID=A0A0E9WX77_ANGAN
MSLKESQSVIAVFGVSVFVNHLKLKDINGHEEQADERFADSNFHCRQHIDTHS